MGFNFYLFFIFLSFSLFFIQGYYLLDFSCFKGFSIQNQSPIMVEYELELVQEYFDMQNKFLRDFKQACKMYYEFTNYIEYIKLVVLLLLVYCNVFPCKFKDPIIYLSVSLNQNGIRFHCVTNVRMLLSCMTCLYI